MNNKAKPALPATRTTIGLSLVFGLALLSGCATTPSAINSHVAPTTATRMAIIHAAAAQLGAPYRPDATGPSAFSDNGLVQYAYAHAGIELPLGPHALLGAGEPVTMAKARPGDLVFYQMQFAGGDDSLRVGLYLNEGEMLFASPRHGEVVIQSINSDYWTGRLLGVVQVLP